MDYEIKEADGKTQYEPPRLTVINLRPEEAVLGHCKSTTSSAEQAISANSTPGRARHSSCGTCRAQNAASRLTPSGPEMFFFWRGPCSIQLF